MKKPSKDMTSKGRCLNVITTSTGVHVFIRAIYFGFHVRLKFRQTFKKNCCLGEVRVNSLAAKCWV